MKKPILNLQLQTEDELPSDDLYTGRYLISLLDEKEDLTHLREVISDKAGLSFASSSDFQSEGINEENIGKAEAIIYEEFGVALVGGEDEQISILQDNASDYIIEPEVVVSSPNPGSAFQGYATYGLQITDVLNNNFSGNGVKVAVLDTGFDFNHPDFSGRTIHQASFVPGESSQDINGHGTHCIGTACGFVNAANQRYGIAHKSDIYVGKVLGGKEGRGAQSWILNGMVWAVRSGCDIISMSLGSAVWPGQGFSVAYDRAGRYALANGTTVIAAAGNESNRQHGVFNPVGSPANCPSIMAVGGIDANFNMYNHSNRSINPNGRVDIVGPAVQVYSSWPMNRRYNVISGTSMATPHVAGIAALYKEKYPQANPGQIWQLLLSNAKPLNHPSVDVGSGLVQAP